jgi:hypothetical protein
MNLDNRTLAEIVWIILVSIFFNSTKKGREASLSLIAAFVGKGIRNLYFLTILYSTIIVILLSLIGYWGTDLLLETIIWIIVSGFSLILNVNKLAEDGNLLKNLIKDNLKLILVIEFVFRFYQFNFWHELLLIPVIAFLIMMIPFVENKNVTPYPNTIKSILETSLLVLILIIVINSIINIIKDWEQFFSIDNLKAFMLPIILSMALIPWVYLIVVYLHYENIFTRLRHLLQGNDYKQYAKRRVVFKCGINLSKLKSMSKKINVLYRGSSKDEIRLAIK